MKKPLIRGAFLIFRTWARIFAASCGLGLILAQGLATPNQRAHFSRHLRFRSMFALWFSVRGLNQTLYFSPGTYTLKKMICPAYVSGSGNYLVTTVPIGLRNVTGISISQNSSIGIYLQSGTLLAETALDLTSVVLTQILNTHFTFEIKFTTTQTISKMAIVHFTEVPVTFT